MIGLGHRPIPARGASGFAAGLALLLLLAPGPSAAQGRQDVVRATPSLGQSALEPREASSEGYSSADDASVLEAVGLGELGGPTAASPAWPVTQRSDGYRSEVEAAWFSGGADASSRARNARARAFQVGAANFESAARALAGAARTERDRLEYTRMAVELAPDLPMLRMAHASALFGSGKHVEALREAAAGLAAIPRNLEASVWLAGSLLGMFAAVLVMGSLVFIVLAGISVFGNAAHDLGDLVSGEMPDFARVALLGSVVLLPLLFGEAFMGLVLGLFALGFAYGDPACRRALALAAALLLLGLYPVTRMAGIALTLLDSDPVASAAHDVVQGIESPLDLETLVAAEGSDWLAQYALALRERRVGNGAMAFERYTQLLKSRPGDPVILSALANIRFEQGENDASIELSERAAGRVESARLLFNLAQAYARSFRMEELEGAMGRAQALDPELVADLSKFSAPGFVADLPVGIAPIRDRMIQSARGEAFIQPISDAIMPGRLGRGWVATSTGFAAAAFLALLIGSRWEHASSCVRCGGRICRRCQGTVWNQKICDGCHHLFDRPEATDPKLRMARLAQLRRREARVGRMSLAASLLLPGVGGFLARRPDLGFLGLFFFGWGTALLFWRNGIVSDPLAVGGAAPLAFSLAGAVVAIGYATVIATGLRIRRSL